MSVKFLKAKQSLLLFVVVIKDAFAKDGKQQR
jgi:hypothetical protein